MKRKYSVKKILLIAIGVFLAGKVAHDAWYGWTHAGEVIEAAAGVTHDPKPQAPAPAPATTAKPVDVSVYIAPEAEDWPKSAGLTEGAIKAAAQRVVVDHHIDCISENAVLEGSDDWLSIGLTRSSADAPVAIEMSVRNGASANHQLIRWQAQKPLSSPNDVLPAIESLATDLAAANASPAYRKGRMSGE